MKTNWEEKYRDLVERIKNAAIDTSCYDLDRLDPILQLNDIVRKNNDMQLGLGKRLMAIKYPHQEDWVMTEEEADEIFDLLKAPAGSPGVWDGPKGERIPESNPDRLS